MGLRAKPNSSSSSNNRSINNISISSSNNNKNNNSGNSSSSINSIKSDCKVKQTSVAAAAAIATTCITSTYRSSSTSALVATAAAAAAAASSVRPQTLNVHHSRETPTDQTQSFFGDVLNAWRTKARCNVVPAERTQELFHELSFHPSDKQIGEMLQTAKGLTKRRGSHHSSGLTFGEFCVLAADLKRFRVSSLAPTTTLNGDKVNLLRSLKNSSGSRHEATRSGAAAGNELRCTKSLSNVTDVPDASTPVEVFLGGSCNPTTWRADVAIPALQELGISFYNPQVSDWTPDLIELEHRAKEKARVLFFVMDSETRATAGAIEAAHIAGQNCKQLVLILHPYKQDQCILNERISQQEYVDLTRNQLLLKELVSRRGLPVLDSIPLGLQRTKEILRGIRDPPSNIASILVVIRGAFDRVNPLNDTISTEQCQRALSYLGYAQSLLAIGSLNKIITSQRAALVSLQKRGGKKKCVDQQQPRAATNAIDFELFCVVAAYLSVLQQEIHESGCISPIKGTNVPPPPVYLTNMQGDEGFANSYYYISKNISRTSSSTSVPNADERLAFSNDLFSQSRDSGTSSPQPQPPPQPPETSLKSKLHIGSGTTSGEASQHSNIAEEESDSNDSVFSSSSSINSINCSTEATLLLPGVESRDVYLGGSCYLRTTWRQAVAIPYFKTHGVSFHLPALHESLQSSRLDLPDKAFEESSSLNTHERTFVRTRRKCRNSADGVENGVGAGAEAEEETIREEECTFSSSSWSLAPVRNLFNPSLLDSSRVLLFVITNETRSLAPMTLAAHCIGLMYNVVLSVQMLPDDCIIGHEKLTATAVKDYNRGRAYLIDLAKRQGVPVFSELQPALECTVGKIKAFNSRN